MIAHPHRPTTRISHPPPSIANPHTAYLALALLQAASLLRAHSGHALEGITAVTALGALAGLLQDVKSQLAAGGHDLDGAIALGVVAMTTTVSKTLNHLIRGCRCEFRPGMHKATPAAYLFLSRFFLLASNKN